MQLGQNELTKQNFFQSYAFYPMMHSFYSPTTKKKKNQS